MKMLILFSTLMCSLLINPSTRLVMADEEPSYKLQWSTSEQGLLVNYLQMEFYDISLKTHGPPEIDRSSFIRFNLGDNAQTSAQLNFDVCEKMHWDERQKKCRVDKRKDQFYGQEFFNANRIGALTLEKPFSQHGRHYFRLKFQFTCAHIDRKRFEVKLVVHQQKSAANKSQIFDIIVDNNGKIASFGVVNTTSNQLRSVASSQTSTSRNSSAIALRVQQHVGRKLVKGIVVWKNQGELEDKYLAEKLKVEYFGYQGVQARWLNFFARFQKEDEYQFAIYEINENIEGALLMQFPHQTGRKTDHALQFKLPNARQQRYSLLFVIKRIIGGSNDSQTEKFLIELEESLTAGQLSVTHNYADAKEKLTFIAKWKEENGVVNLIYNLEVNFFLLGNYIEFYASPRKILEKEDRTDYHSHIKGNIMYMAKMCDSENWDMISFQCINVYQAYVINPLYSSEYQRYNIRITGRHKRLYFVVEMQQVRQQVLAVDIDTENGMKIVSIANKSLSTPANKSSQGGNAKSHKRDGGSSGSSSSSTRLKQGWAYNF